MSPKHVSEEVEEKAEKNYSEKMQEMYGDTTPREAEQRFREEVGWD